MEKYHKCLIIIITFIFSLFLGIVNLFSQSSIIDQNMDLISDDTLPISEVGDFFNKSYDSCFHIGLIKTGYYQESLNRLTKVGFTDVTIIPDSAGFSEFVNFNIIYLPVQWAGFYWGSLETIESNSEDYINYIEKGGNLFIEQPNPYSQPGGRVTPTIIPYPVTFYNAYDNNDFPPIAVDSIHEITQGIEREDLIFPADSMSSVDENYHVLIVGATSFCPSLLISEYGLGKIVIQTAHPATYAAYPFSDEIYTRMINWLVKREYSTEPIIECKSYTWIDGVKYTESNNTATYTLTNSNGCDSILKLDLTITNVDTSIYIRNDTIYALATEALYQWLNCDNYFEDIQGENNQFYIPSDSGNYAVQIIQNDCIDTSSCINYSINSVNNSISDEFYIYPNPTEGMVLIEFKDLSSQPSVKVFNNLGMLIDETTDIKNKTYNYNISGGSGMYIFEIMVENKIYFYKVYKK